MTEAIVGLEIKFDASGADKVNAEYAKIMKALGQSVAFAQGGMTAAAASESAKRSRIYDDEGKKHVASQKAAIDQIATAVKQSFQEKQTLAKQSHEENLALIKATTVTDLAEIEKRKAAEIETLRAYGVESKTKTAERLADKKRESAETIALLKLGHEKEAEDNRKAIAEAKNASAERIAAAKRDQQAKLVGDNLSFRREVEERRRKEKEAREAEAAEAAKGNGRQLSGFRTLNELEVQYAKVKTSKIVEEMDHLITAKKKADQEILAATSSESAHEAEIKSKQIRQEINGLDDIVRKRREVANEGAGAIIGRMGVGREITGLFGMSGEGLASAAGVTLAANEARRFGTELFNEGIRAQQVLTQERTALEAAGVARANLNKEMARENALASELNARWDVESDRVRVVETDIAQLGHVYGANNILITKMAVAVEESTKNLGEGALKAEDFTKIFNVSDPTRETFIGRLRMRYRDLADALSQTTTTEEALAVANKYLGSTYVELEQRADANSNAAEKVGKDWAEIKRSLGLGVSESVLPMIHSFAQLTHETKQQGDGLQLWGRVLGDVFTVQVTRAMHDATIAISGTNKVTEENELTTINAWNAAHGYAHALTEAERAARDAAYAEGDYGNKVRAATENMESNTKAQADNLIAVIARYSMLRDMPDQTDAGRTFIQGKITNLNGDLVRLAKVVKALDDAHDKAAKPFNTIVNPEQKTKQDESITALKAHVEARDWLRKEDEKRNKEAFKHEYDDEISFLELSATHRSASIEVDISNKREAEIKIYENKKHYLEAQRDTALKMYGTESDDYRKFNQQLAELDFQRELQKRRDINENVANFQKYQETLLQDSYHRQYEDSLDHWNKMRDVVSIGIDGVMRPFNEGIERNIQLLGKDGNAVAKWGLEIVGAFAKLEIKRGAEALDKAIFGEKPEEKKTSSDLDLSFKSNPGKSGAQLANLLSQMGVPGFNDSPGPVGQAGGPVIGGKSLVLANPNDWLIDPSLNEDKTGLIFKSANVFTAPKTQRSDTDATAYSQAGATGRGHEEQAKLDELKRARNDAFDTGIKSAKAYRNMEEANAQKFHVRDEGESQRAPSWLPFAGPFTNSINTQGDLMNRQAMGISNSSAISRELLSQTREQSIAFAAELGTLPLMSTGGVGGLVHGLEHAVPYGGSALGAFGIDQGVHRLLTAGTEHVMAKLMMDEQHNGDANPDDNSGGRNLAGESSVQKEGTKDLATSAKTTADTDETEAHKALVKNLGDVNDKIGATQKGFGILSAGADLLGINLGKKGKAILDTGSQVASIAGSIASVVGIFLKDGGGYDGKVYYAADGMVTGPGGPRDDRIHAMISNGEAILNANAVSHYGGPSFVKSLNRRQIPSINEPRFQPRTISVNEPAYLHSSNSSSSSGYGRLHPDDIAAIGNHLVSAMKSAPASIVQVKDIHDSSTKYAGRVLTY